MAIQTLFGSVEQEPTLLERLKTGVEKTRSGLVSRLEDTLAGRKEIDAEPYRHAVKVLALYDLFCEPASPGRVTVAPVLPPRDPAAWPPAR